MIASPRRIVVGAVTFGLLAIALAAPGPTASKAAAATGAKAATVGPVGPKPDPVDISLSAPRSLAATAQPGTTRVENWTGYAGPFRKTTPLNRMTVVKTAGATDGKALKMLLSPNPLPGPRKGVEIASNNTSFRYGTFGTRMKTADCVQKDRLGVVTGLLTFSPDEADANLNGLQDNDEIDIEVLCGQPEVIWMSIWTDYDEPTDVPRKISRVINMQTGQVLQNCYIEVWLGACLPLLPGENSPESVLPLAGFNAGKQFRSYSFDWEPDRVRFYVSDNEGKPMLIWDYQGPSERIPQKPSMFLQNLWYTANWSPLNSPSINRPAVTMTAYLDSTTVPK